MKKLIVLASLFAFGCSQNEIEVTPIENYTFSIDAVLEQNGKQSLPKDKNGLYHLKLLRSTKQQPYRVTGRILVNGKTPKYPHSIQWESNLYWWIKERDTLTYITKSYINYYTGEFTIVKLPPLIAAQSSIIPTINKSSYSGTNGEINTIIAPVGQMIGDTMVVKGYNYESKKHTYTKIVLE